MKEVHDRDIPKLKMREVRPIPEFYSRPRGTKPAITAEDEFSDGWESLFLFDRPMATMPFRGTGKKMKHFQLRVPYQHFRQDMI